MADRLSNGTLGKLSAGVQVPNYDRKDITPGIVHLGVGAFHRAHQAVAVDDSLNAGARDWGIVAVSLRSPDTRDALGPQDGLYTLAIREGDAHGEREHLRVIGAITDLRVGPEDPAGLVAIMADPSIRIVSLTITEKGYMRGANGQLDAGHADVQHDLAHIGKPKTALGFIIASIEARRARGIEPFTVLSCDNLPANGETLKRLLVAFARLRSDELGAYVSEHVACPSTMVDRIVPATTDADRQSVAEGLGAEDAWPVLGEPFLLWVIEDDFPLGRPDLKTEGVTFVEDVAPYELMKLRLLNGAHSTLAYTGLLLGHRTVAEAFARPELRKLVDGIWAEAKASLPDAGLDADGFARGLVGRFANTALNHKLEQIAMDGSQKLPQRLIMGALERLDAGGRIDHMAFALAAWITALRDHAKLGFKLADPRLDELRALAGQGAAPVLAALGYEDERLTQAAAAALSAIEAEGTGVALAKLVG